MDNKSRAARTMRAVVSLVNNVFVIQCCLAIATGVSIHVGQYAIAGTCVLLWGSVALSALILAHAGVMANHGQ